MNELIGRPGVLEPREVGVAVYHVSSMLYYNTLYTPIYPIYPIYPITHALQGLKLKKTQSLDVSYCLDSLTCYPVKGENLCDLEDTREWLVHGDVNDNGRTFDDIILEDKDVMAVIDNNKDEVHKTLHITNTDRAAFARISGVIAKKYGDGGFDGKLKFALTGAAGQSFGAFFGKGMDATLSGYANDYVGKSMAGGRITVAPPARDRAASKACTVEVYGGEDSSVTRSQFNMVGNTVLYGATGGELYVNGRGGERFAVRNSGALGVVEGLGDHGCEYMTAGTVVNLGSIGRNFGAGTTTVLWVHTITVWDARLVYCTFFNTSYISFSYIYTVCIPYLYTLYTLYTLHRHDRWSGFYSARRRMVR